MFQRNVVPTSVPSNFHTEINIMMSNNSSLPFSSSSALLSHLALAAPVFMSIRREEGLSSQAGVWLLTELNPPHYFIPALFRVSHPAPKN